MSKSVMLDAGHYAYYNQSPAIKIYYESIMNWKLHLMLKEQLEKYGIKVDTTRPNEQQDRGLYDRGYASKGYDLFLSIHSNAVDNSVHEDIDYPVCFTQVSGASDQIGTLLSQCVERVMGTQQHAMHWSVKNDQGTDYYGVLRGAAAAGTVGCIIQHSFHTNTRSTQWLLNDKNLRLMAQEEAKVINDYLNGQVQPSRQLQDPTSYDPSLKAVYVVQSQDGFLNLRYGPGSTYDIITPMLTNEQVECYGYYSILNNIKWLYVVYKGQAGFCNMNYLKLKSKQPSKVPYCTATVVNTHSLYVRTGPGQQYPPLQTVPIIYEGNRVDICDSVVNQRNEKWYYIRVYGKYYGYSRSSYLKID